MTAWNLTRQGSRVLMLDAGAKFQWSQFWSHVRPWQVPEKPAAGQELSAGRANQVSRDRAQDDDRDSEGGDSGDPLVRSNVMGVPGQAIQEHSTCRMASEKGRLHLSTLVQKVLSLIARYGDITVSVNGPFCRTNSAPTNRCSYKCSAAGAAAR
jgi:hypothetical protein